jgi:dUTP pyrophosphatase
MQFTKLNESAIIPTKGTSKSAGYDLYALEDRTIIGGQGNMLIPTGITVQVPPGCYARIAARSGLSVKEHLAVSAGVVDEDYYPGHVQVVVFCTKNDHVVHIKKGDRFAQIIPEMIYQEVVAKGTERRGGFGSTDIGHIGAGC